MFGPEQPEGQHVRRTNQMTLALPPASRKIIRRNPWALYNAEMNRSYRVSRRGFLKTSVFAGAASSVGDLSLKSLFAANASRPAPDQPTAPSWVDKPMRWAQLTLAED